MQNLPSLVQPAGWQFSLRQLLRLVTASALVAALFRIEPSLAVTALVAGAIGAAGLTLGQTLLTRFESSGTTLHHTGLMLAAIACIAVGWLAMEVAFLESLGLLVCLFCR